MKKKPVQSSTSFVKKLIIPMLCITLLQSAVFMGGILATGSIKEMETSAYESLQSVLDTRGNNVSTRMVRAWGSPVRFSSVVEASMQDYKDGRNTISTATGDALLQLLKSTPVTGAFIIYDSPVNDNYPCLYLCNASDDIAEFPMEDSNINILIGNQTALSRPFPLSKNWRPYLTLMSTDAQRSFFHDASLLVEEHPNYTAEQLAKWQLFRTIPGTKRNVLTYSIPLIDDNGDFYGIVGIDVTQDLMNGMLPYEELISSGNGSYFLGNVSTSPTGTENFYVHSGLMDFSVDLSSSLSFIPEIIHGNIYQAIDKQTGEELLIPIHRMNLYPEDSVFQDEIWVLAAAAPKNEVLFKTIQLMQSLLITFLVSLLLGVLFAFLMAAIFSQPILKLTNLLRHADPEKQLELPPVDIQEIDELSSSITVLSHEVKIAASRLSQILAASNVPIGAIEYDTKHDKVICTENIPALLFFPKEKQECLSYTTAEFEKYHQVFLAHTRPYRLADDSNTEKSNRITLQYTDDAGISNWLSFEELYREDNRITVVQNVTETVSETIKLEYERDYDSLTNLLNRRSFKEKVQALLKQGNLKYAAMVMWDMDNLKYINDTYGHDTGDRYLSEAARLFGSLSGYRGLVGRRSGDEFFAFLHSYSSKEDLYCTISNLHNRLRNTIFVPKDSIQIAVRASGGIAWYPEDASTYADLTRYADFAMYQVKRTKRGNLLEFSSEIFERDSLLLSGQEALERFIDRQEVQFAFQPIVEVATGTVFAYEALMRPTCRELATVTDVMRLSRAQSKLYEIEKLTWNGVLKAFREQQAAIGNARVFINSIPNMVLQPEDMRTLNNQYSDLFPHLVVEIIESEQSDPTCMQEKHLFADKWGSAIALDDFGAGYSTESSLLTIAPNFVKIDMSIVQGVDVDPNRQKLVSNILSYTHPRNMKVIAEGVETEDELRILMEMGVDLVQGFYFAKPSFHATDLTPSQKAHLADIRSDIAASGKKTVVATEAEALAAAKAMRELEAAKKTKAIAQHCEEALAASHVISPADDSKE